MNYLIVAPRMTTTNEQYYPFPMGIAYVSSSLKATGRKVVTLNITYKQETTRQLLERYIMENDIDVLAVGGLTTQYLQVKEIINLAKEIKPIIVTVVGGGIITSDPIAAMQALENVDYGIIGEGEITICELADALENKIIVSDVNGIIYENKGEWVINAPREEIMDLDSIPFPDYDGFDFAETLTKMPTDFLSVAETNLATVCFGRSCAFNCTFCFHPSGSKYRQRSLDNIFKELDILCSKYLIKNLVISDELFAYKSERVEEFCRRIGKYKVGFIVSLRVDIVTKELLQTLKDYGCLHIGFGLESADNRILKSMRKQITVEQIEHALALANEVGITIQGNFIFGDLEETVETAMSTINWWQKHSEYQIPLKWIVVYPGTHLYKVACEKGIIKDPVQYIKDGCPYINVSKMSDAEYREISLKINSFASKNKNKLLNTHIEMKNMGKVDFIGKCPFCEYENRFINVDVFRIVTNQVCKKCKKSLNILVADYIDDILEKNIAKMLKTEKIALWPAIDAVTNMFEKAFSLQDDNVFFIDSSPLKQGSIFFNKIIQPPDIIIEKNIKIVILTLTTFTVNEIIGTINSKYSQVQHIIYSGELINPKFNLKER